MLANGGGFPSQMARDLELLMLFCSEHEQLVETIQLTVVRDRRHDACDIRVMFIWSVAIIL